MKPPRRTPKPFIVEVRRGGLRPALASIDKQPDVPSLPIELAKPVERPTEPEPIAAVDGSRGRVLPALDDPAPIVTVPGPKRRRSISRAPAAISDHVEVIGEADMARPDADERPPPQPPGLPRLPRSAFPLGERWKARLPAPRYKARGRKGGGETPAGGLRL